MHARLDQLATIAAALCCVGWAQIRAGEGDNQIALRIPKGTRVLYHVHTRGVAGVPLARVQAALRRAHESWHLPCYDIRFAVNPNGRDADTPLQDGQYVIRFEDQRLPPEIDPERVLAFVQHVGVFCDGTALEADMTFNAVNFDWSDGDGGRAADIETVALHEAGHVLGLDHSDLRSAVMFPSIRERVRRTLSRDDTEGICTIYGDGRGAPCDRDRDCRHGETCTLISLGGDTQDTRCAPPRGAGGPGDRCDAQVGICENGCGNGLCGQDGRCTTICRDDGDCFGGRTCFQQPLGGGGEFGLCMSITLCEDDIDACPAGQACFPTPHPADPQRVLRFCGDSPGRGQTGQPCREPSDCAGGFCLFGLCSQLCDSLGDCPESFDCAERLLPGLGEAVSVCELPDTPCARPDDCPAGLACAYLAQPDEIINRCRPSDADGVAGDPCARNRDCRAGICLVDDVCPDVCRGDGDCPLDMACGFIQINSLPSRGCVPLGERPDGSIELPDAGPPGDADLRPSPDASLPDASIVPDALAPTLDAGPPVRLDGPLLPVADSAADGAVPVVIRRRQGGDGGGCRLTGHRAPAGLILLLALGLIRRRSISP